MARVRRPAGVSRVPDRHGTFADMTVFSEDTLTIDPQRIQDVSVLRTIVAGDTVYQAQ